MKKTILSLSVILFTAFVIISCNNSSEKSKKSTDSIESTDTAVLETNLTDPINLSSGMDEFDSTKQDLIPGKAGENKTDSIIATDDKRNETYRLTISDLDLRLLFNTDWSGDDEIVALYLKFFGKNDRYAIKICGVSSRNRRTQWIKIRHTTSNPNDYTRDPDGYVRNNQIITKQMLINDLGFTETNGKLSNLADINLVANNTPHQGPHSTDKNYLCIKASVNRTATSQSTKTLYETITNPCPPCVYCVNGVCPTFD